MGAMTGDVYLPEPATIHRPLPNNTVPDGDIVSWLRAVEGNLRVIHDFDASWVPEWSGATTDPTLGNGTLTARFAVSGERFVGGMKLQIGTTTTPGSGAMAWRLPYGYEFLGNAGDIVGTGVIRNSDGTEWNAAVAVWDGGSDTRFQVFTPAISSGSMSSPLSEPPPADGVLGVHFDADDEDCYLWLEFDCRVKPFDLVVDPGWLHLWWADGPQMRDLALGDGAAPVTVPNEIWPDDALGVSGAVTRVRSHGRLGWRAAFQFAGGHLFNAALTNAPSSGLSIVTVAASEGYQSAAGLSPARQCLVDTDQGGDPRRRVSTASASDDLVLESDAGSASGGAWDNAGHNVTAIWRASTTDEHLNVDTNTLVVNTNLGTGTTLPSIRVGAANDGSWPWRGPIAMVAVYDGDIVDAGFDHSWRRLSNWLAAYYALPTPEYTAA